MGGDIEGAGAAVVVRDAAEGVYDLVKGHQMSPDRRGAGQGNTGSVGAGCHGGSHVAAHHVGSFRQGGGHVEAAAHFNKRTARPKRVGRVARKVNTHVSSCGWLE